MKAKHAHRTTNNKQPTIQKTPTNMERDWHVLGDIAYRKWEAYEMGWSDESVSLQKRLISGSQFGGCIAAISQLDLPRNSKDVPKRILSIYNAAGRKMGQYSIEHECKNIKGVGWSDQEDCAVVFEDGKIIHVDIHGKLRHESNLEVDPAVKLNVIECVFWGNGVVLYTSDDKIIVIEGLASVDLKAGTRQYTVKSGLDKTRTCTALAVIQSLQTRSGLLEILIATSDKSILVADENEVVDQLIQRSIDAPILKMALSPNGRFLACFRQDGVLTVMSSSFTSRVLDLDLRQLECPQQMVWCGEDAVAMQWPQTGVVLVGPFGHHVKFLYDGGVHLIPESDCCRIISSFQHEILQRVPASTQAVGTIGSTEPVAFLYDAMEAFDIGDSKSDENIRSIATSNQLLGAVTDCIQAASAEFDVRRQQAFMKAASYGKVFCADMDPTEFVSTAIKLRILNSIRKPGVGLPLTFQQYNRLTPEVLVSRLTFRNMHLLALRVCEMLKLKNERVLVHWACSKIRRLSSTSATDEDICGQIKERLKSYDRVPFTEVARAANSCGRHKLATMILDLEEYAIDQVPLLLSMREEESALKKSVASENMDLIYLCLLYAERSKKADPDAFHRLVSAYPEALSLLRHYYRHSQSVAEGDKSKLLNLLLYNRNYIDAGILAMLPAVRQNSTSSGSSGADIAKAALREAAQLLSLGGGRGDAASYKTLAEDQYDLMDTQKTLEVRTLKTFVGKSVIGTLVGLVDMSLEVPTEAAFWEREIVKLIKKFRISEKSLWYIKIERYREYGQWNELGKLANEKKSPVGYKPFAAVCIRCKRPLVEIEKYIDRITTVEEKFDLSMEAGLWHKAADAAAKLKDSARLRDVLRSSRGDADLERSIQDMINKL